MVPFTTAMGFVEHVENRLGWSSSDEIGKPRWRTLITEASKVKNAIATNPSLYTWENLATTVDWFAGKYEEASPLKVVYAVEKALKATYRPPAPRPADIAVAIIAAVELEQSHHKTDWEVWVRKLTRAQGVGRDVVYAEWQEARA